MSFQFGNTSILIRKEGEIHLMVWFARSQRFETYFCKVDVRNGKTVKHNIWSPIFAIFSPFDPYLS
jgi:hypothetical protein